MSRVILVCVALLLGVIFVHPPAASTQELSPNQIYAQAAPAVVFIAGYGPGLKGMGGTGSLIDSSGLVLTNAHVVVEEGSHQPYPQLAVYFKPERVTGNQEKDLSRRFKARVVAFDRALDLALLKLETPAAGLVSLILGDPDQVHIGDRVVAIGHPEQGGLWTLTTGVISAEFENFQKVPGKDVFQTEASFNRGNSGGPLLDAFGHQVGINTSIARQSADGMAIVSINFSLKSSVAQTWLRKQGIQVAYALRPADQPAMSSSAPPAVVTPDIPIPTVPATPAVPSPPTAQSPSAPAKPEAPTPAPRVEAPPVAPATPIRPGPEAHVPPDPHPYDLDRLVLGLEAAEKDLENMMDEMQRKTRPRR